MNLDGLTNQELINYVYSEIAGKKVGENVKDFADFSRWWNVVNKLPEPLARVYRLGILNLQVMNGGFFQYFDNGYGIFSFETLGDLRAIQASKMHQLLQYALEIINPDNHRGEAFVHLILQGKFDLNYNDIGDRLNKLDALYYGLEEAEGMEKLLGAYLKKHTRELQQYTT